MNTRKLVLLLLAILLAFTAWDAVKWYASPESISIRQTGNIQTLKGESFADTAALEPFQSIVYHLESPLREDTIATLTCYQEDYSSITDEQHPLKGTAQIAFQVPLAKYAGLDCYINADVKISDITISDQPSGEVHSRYPVRPLNILVPAIALLAVILLFVYIKPLNKLIKTIDKNILDPDTRYKGVTVGYIIFAAAALLHHIYVTMYHKYVLTGYTDLGIPLLVFSIITFLFGKLWQDKVSWILLALLCLKYARTALEGQQVLDTTAYIYCMSVYAFFGCYGAGRAIHQKYWKTFLTVFCALWTTAALVYAAFGIHVTITGIPVKNLGSEWFTIARDGRFYYVYHPVTSGIAISTAMAVAILGFALAKKKILKTLFVLAAVILFMAGSLTGTRTAYVVSGVELAFLLCLLVYDRLKPGIPKKPVLTTGKWIVLTVLFLAATGLIAFAQSYTSDIFRVFRTRGGLLLSHAYAEGQSQLSEVAHRGFVISANPDVSFSGRITIWRNALEIITSNPRNLFLGQSVYNPILIVDNLRASRGLFYVYHCHNTFLQILLENGLPGLLLYLSFFLFFVFHGIRVLKNRDLPFWQRLIPLPAIGGFVADLVDSTCHVTFGYPQMTLLFLFAGFTVALSRQAKKNASAN